MNGNEIKQKLSNKFLCNYCDYSTSRKSNMTSHIMSAKHKMAMNGNEIKQNSGEIKQNPGEIKQQAVTNFVCNVCDKKYKDYSGLWRHKKKCIKPHISEETIYDEEPLSDKKLIMELLKSNNELQKQMIELCKDKNIVTNNNTNMNCNNTNNFNLQFFLNETCKDALNIDEFVNQIQLQLSDLDMIGKVGYVEGITKIFLRNLKALDVCKRPIHCSDLKREVLYIKDKGAWEKDNDDNVKIKKVIKGIEDKNIKQLPQWRAENPTHEDTETKKHMEYVHILIESMGGTPIEDDNKRLEKIIRNIAKEVVIDKHH